MTLTPETFFTAVSYEIERSEKKWPDNAILHRLAALTGEVGELAEGVLKKEPSSLLIEEAVQVAATAYRAAKAISEAP